MRHRRSNLAGGRWRPPPPPARRRPLLELFPIEAAGRGQNSLTGSPSLAGVFREGFRRAVALRAVLRPRGARVRAVHRSEVPLPHAVPRPRARRAARCDSPPRRRGAADRAARAGQDDALPGARRAAGSADDCVARHAPVPVDRRAPEDGARGFRCHRRTRSRQRPPVERVARGAGRRAAPLPLLARSRSGHSPSSSSTTRQTIPPPVLDQIRELSDVEREARVLQVVLVGEPELATTLRSSGVRGAGAANWDQGRSGAAHAH